MVAGASMHRSALSTKPPMQRFATNAPHMKQSVAKHSLSLGVGEGEAGFRVAAVLAEGAGVQVDA